MKTLTTRELAEEYIARFNNQDLAGLVKLHKPNYVSHDNGQDGDLKGFEAALGGFFAGVPDARFEVINIVVEGDLFVINFITHGTNTGNLYGAPPTGKKLAFPEIRVRRVEDGLIAEEWGLMEYNVLNAQLKG